MTCQLCKGIGRLPMINVWEMIRQMEHEPGSKDIPLYPDAPCPNCNGEEFWGHAKALIEKHGQPFADGPVRGATCFEHGASGTLASCLTTSTDDDE